MAEDQIVLVEGEIQKDEKAVKILAESVVSIDRVESTWTASVRIHLDMSRTDRETLLNLNDVFRRHPGASPAVIALRDSGRVETIISLSDDLRLEAGAPLRQAVRRLVGYNAVETVCVDPATGRPDRDNGGNGGRRRRK
jgi:DNA polymerase-3 subunit alpha